jgi:NADH dehydrogenase
MDTTPHVVIVGGGFGGLHAAARLKKAPLRVTVVDRRNFHLFQPLLYQVATGGLSPANISAPLRSILRRHKNTEVLLANVVGFDTAGRRVLLNDGAIEYDTLVVAVGARHSYFGRDDWAPLAPGLKSIEDATEMRGRILYAFEAAESETDPEKRKQWLTFVIVGGGPTGMELAGALSEIANHTLKHDFRHINPPDATILVVEASDRPLAAFPPELSEKATRSLKRLNVSLRTKTKVTDVQADHVVLHCGDREETVATRTVLWAAGVQASALGRALAKATGAELDRAGRVVVQPDLTVPGHPEIFVIGDLACFTHQTGRPLPGLAAVAIRQGDYVAQAIKRRLRERSLAPFRYKDHGIMATIGRSAAVASLGTIKLSGYVAWILWLLVHLMELVKFQNRVLVLMQWGWSYFTRNRAARLITWRADMNNSD